LSDETAFFVRHCGFLLAFAVLAWVIGRAVLSVPRAASWAGATALRCTLGIGILAHVVGALGMAGMLKVGPLVGTALALLALGLWAGRSETKLGAVRPRTIWTVILGAALLALVAWPLLWRALWPPAEFDSVAYHLALARWWANHGRIDVVPHLRFPVAPHNAHALFAAFMVLQDEVAPQLLSVLAVILAG